ncbi:hypothetical protein I0C86_41170 [Plantactinospora sp. S1510]|uniref:Uncharacterized protein n=1 Tax=Plantactinospora alkalitolerans TaxID=2789879 RepID=A0ABS0HAS9_9ACTN|nr:hypothetical protein [Plantactinospora alkalitolerans]MBF9135264.1 hypothetical protein [Plantactinospora alkalitolerans]
MSTTMYAEDRRMIIIYNAGGDWHSEHGTVQDVAKIFSDLDHGYADLGGAPQPYGLDDAGKPVPLEVKVERGEYNADNWSDRSVTVTFPDGAVAVGSYRVDGRC